MYSINAGSYVTAGTVTTAAVGNVLNVVSAYPRVTKVAGGDSTNLITFRVTNSGSTNLILSGVTYFANAQTPADVQKDFELYDGSTLLSTGTIVAGSNRRIVLFTPLSIAAQDNVTLNVRFTTPFVPTPGTDAGNRIFQIGNVNYAQMFANGNLGAYGDINASYLTTVGLPVSATDIN